jgi:L-threonylcarbamoyladenylate synthase
VLTSEDALALRECVASGGVAVFPADTVYGLGCDPESREAIERLYALKGRPAQRPAAVMYFSLQSALSELPELRQRERRALRALLPGPLTLLLPNRRQRFLRACGPDPHTLGLRVPRLEGALAQLREVDVPIMQSSANLSGEPDAHRLSDVPLALREAADVVLDGGELPGIASTVLDLRGYEECGEWHVVRAGPVARAQLALVLDGAASSR